jgi:23S rRNA (uracil-5-)-methyltransferase RumA
MAKPLCEYFGTCGGCTSQHIDYSLQLENKKKQLQNILNFQDIKVFSDKEYFYRNRMDLIFTNNSLGFRKKSHWDSVVPINKCVIAEEKINEIIREINFFFKDADYFNVKRHSGTYRYAVIRVTNKASSISFVLNDKSPKLKDAVEKIKRFSDKTSVKNILVTYIPPYTDNSTSNDFFVIKGSDQLKTTLANKHFVYSAQGFFQNNHTMAEKMQLYISDLLKSYQTNHENLLDLYGGVGTFSIINADLFKEVTIVESFQSSIDSAKNNIELNKTKNIKAFVSDAKQIDRLNLKCSYIITDPPRTGMDIKTIFKIRMLKPKVIVYISCNPEQLKKDLEKFPDYNIKSAAVFDLFPQTPHSEAIVELTAKNI